MMAWRGQIVAAKWQRALMAQGATMKFLWITPLGFMGFKLIASAIDPV
jgi:hypothetical protein